MWFTFEEHQLAIMIHYKTLHKLSMTIFRQKYLHKFWLKINFFNYKHSINLSVVFIENLNWYKIKEISFLKSWGNTLHPTLKYLIV